VEITYIFGLTVRYAGFHKEKSGVEYFERKEWIWKRNFNLLVKCVLGFILLALVFVEEIQKAFKGFSKYLR
jgi:hypothetical protein